MSTVRRFTTWAAALALAAAAGFALRGCPVFTRPVTVTSLSPDDTWRVAVVERPAFMQPDRNFEVWLEEVGSRRTRVVFRSPDEGRPVGSERVVWAADGSRVLILGRHFVVADRGRLLGGEQAYLMMDVRSGEVWCNSSQQPDYPGFGVEALRAAQWQGWVPP